MIYIPFFFALLIHISSVLLLDTVSLSLMDTESLDQWFCTCVVADKDLRSLLESFQQPRMLKNFNRKGGMKLRFCRIQTKKREQKQNLQLLNQFILFSQMQSNPSA